MVSPLFLLKMLQIEHKSKQNDPKYLQKYSDRLRILENYPQNWPFMAYRVLHLLNSLKKLVTKLYRADAHGTTQLYRKVFYFSETVMKSLAMTSD